MSDQESANVVLPRYVFDQLLRDQRDMAEKLGQLTELREDFRTVAAALASMDVTLRGAGEAGGMMGRMRELETAFKRHEDDCKVRRTEFKSDWRMWVGLVASWILSLIGLVAAASRAKGQP